MVDFAPLRDEILDEYSLNIAHKVRGYVEKLEYGEDFYLRALDDELQIRTEGYRPARTQELRRLVEKKVLRKFKDRPGYYRKLQPIDIIEWWDAPVDPLKIYLPFGLSGDKGIHVKIFEGSVIALAGRQNAGKTSLCQEFIEENIDINPYSENIHLFVNESGGPEIRYRLENNDNITPEKWREHVTVINRASDFADVIHPQAINVIDYLTDYNEAWGIGRQMSEIYEVVRNNTGIVWINLQKDQELPTTRGSGKTEYTSGRDVGRGGAVTLDIPRLYLSMDYDKIKVVKAKFAGKENPTRMVHNFDVAEDGTIMPRGIWYLPDGNSPGRWG